MTEKERTLKNLECLRTLVLELEYPKELMIPTHRYIEGDGFFPGANGLPTGATEI